MTVWCAFWTREVIGHFFFFFVIDEEAAISLYGGLISVTSYNCFRLTLTYLGNMDNRNFWLKQDGVTCHSFLKLLHFCTKNSSTMSSPTTWWPRMACQIMLPSQPHAISSSGILLDQKCMRTIPKQVLSRRKISKQ